MAVFQETLLGSLVEYLDEGRLRLGLVTREQGARSTIVDAGGRERTVSRDLVLVRHKDLRVTRENLAAQVAALDEERARLATELDLNLLWEVVREHGRSYRAEELAELFFGRRSAAAVAVMLDALLNDRLFFTRRHMDFIARGADQVDRLRTQYDKVRVRSEAGRRTRALIREILDDGALPSADEAAAVIAELTRYLENPFTRNRDTTAMLEAAVSEMTPAEAAYVILERLDAAPPGPRFAVIGGVRSSFSAAALEEAESPPVLERTAGTDTRAVTIDDEETLEIDDALSCERLADGATRVRIHIALVADFVPRGGAMDQEAALRGATIYLPETTVRMLPDAVSTSAASLRAGLERRVLTTDLVLSANGQLREFKIYPALIRIAARLTYDETDRLLAEDGSDSNEQTAMLRRLHDVATKLRERRRSAGAILMTRREPKIRVAEGVIDVKMLDNASPSRQLVAEFMLLSNYAAARMAAERRVPMIYRVQPGTGGDLASQRPHLSLHPEFHAGIGLDCYLQASSPIRRYMDLVLQRQLIAAATCDPAPYLADELLQVLAAAESADADGKELERRAKRYWLLRYLEKEALNRPLEATVLRDGASAELDAYAVRGSLHGAPNVASQTPVIVQIGRVDPVRGWLALDYLSTAT